jgi:16S rRNA (cytosine967-C5)-methyltransferase
VALADWGRAHRFAGSADRAWIGNLVYDSLRRKQSLSYAMQESTPRSLALSALRWSWHQPAAEVASLCTGEGFCPAPLTDKEKRGLAAVAFDDAPPWVRGDYPEWLQDSFSQGFGAEAIAEGQALAQRAPIDLRVNTLKAVREKVLKALARYDASETPYSPLGVRLRPREGGARSPNVEADPAHGRGWFEVQDEGSQMAALLAGVEPRMQIADICAGAGGKTLAMAAQMQNTGQIYVYDADPVRFRPIFERLKRAGARNVQTLPPGQDSALDALEGRMDLVLVDAPCSGTGVWRRRPDAKWRLTHAQLEARLATQRALLRRAAPLVKRGGSLAYVTCSVLPEENYRQVEDFLKHHPDFAALDVSVRAASSLSRPLQSHLRPESPGLLLTPAQHGTDGFYIAILGRAQ